MKHRDTEGTESSLKPSLCSLCLCVSLAQILSTDAQMPNRSTLPRPGTLVRVCTSCTPNACGPTLGSKVDSCYDATLSHQGCHSEGLAPEPLRRLPGRVSPDESL